MDLIQHKSCRLKVAICMLAWVALLELRWFINMTAVTGLWWVDKVSTVVGHHILMSMYLAWPATRVTCM